MTDRPPPPFDRRLLVVSGKGGAGKTVVAAALATLAARDGRRVLLAEVEGRHGMARTLGIAPPGFEEVRGPLGFRVLEIGAREALIEYLAVIMGMGRVAGALRRARVTEVATEAVPGFRDAMVAGKLYELTAWRDGRGGERRPYDLVIVDAPPTGQLVAFMGAAAAYRELIRVGRAARQLESIDRLFREEARVVLVALPEEMAVAETVEAAEALRDLGDRIGPIVANRVLPTVFPRGTAAAARRLSPAEGATRLERAGLSATAETAGDLLTAARAEDERVRAQRRHLSALGKVGLSLVELPALPVAGVGRDEVETLAGVLDTALGGEAG